MSTIVTKLAFWGYPSLGASSSVTGAAIQVLTLDLLKGLKVEKNSCFFSHRPPTKPEGFVGGQGSSETIHNLSIFGAQMIAPLGFPDKSLHKFARCVASRLHLPCETAVHMPLLYPRISAGIVKYQFWPSIFPKKFHDFVKDDLI